jgi:hypothetical protein
MQRMRALGAVMVVAMGGVVGCTPALNWREWQAPGSTLSSLWPCKPQQIERSGTLAGRPVRLALAQCEADGATWALARADVGDPAQVGPALVALRESALGNIGADGAGDPGMAQVPGATPNREARSFSAAGRRPSGATVQLRAALFAHGTTVWQATVLAPRLDAEAAATFFGALRFAPA